MNFNHESEELYDALGLDSDVLTEKVVSVLMPAMRNNAKKSEIAELMYNNFSKEELIFFAARQAHSDMLDTLKKFINLMAQGVDPADLN